MFFCTYFTYFYHLGTLSRAFQECVDAVDLIRPKETRNFNHIDGLPEFLLTFDSKTTPYVKQKILQYVLYF